MIYTIKNREGIDPEIFESLTYSVSVRYADEQLHQQRNGSQLSPFDIEVLKAAAANATDKLTLPLTYVYAGSKGNVTGNVHWFQYDIDTTAITDEFLANFDRIVERHYTTGYDTEEERNAPANRTYMPEIFMAQASASGKLHVIVKTDRPYCLTDGRELDEYCQAYTIYYSKLIRVIEIFTDVDVSTLTTDNGQPVVDLHNCNPKQGLFFSTNTPYINDDFVCASISDEDAEKAIARYHLEDRVSAPKKDKTDIVPTAPFEGDFVITNPHKLLVNKNYTLFGYCGNDVRWRFANVVKWYCKDDEVKARKIIGQLFEHPSDYYFGDYNLNPAFKQAFDTEFGIIEVSDKVSYPAVARTDGTLVEQGKWLSDYANEITKAIDSNKVLQVIAPTGTGKTYLMNRIAQDRKCLIITPYNSQLALYDGNGFNKVVRGQDTDFVKDMTNIAIWDQFVIKMGKKTPDDFKDFIVIVDESHLLFADRSYRQSAAQFVSMLTKFGGKVVLMTATPTAEGNLLTIDSTLSFRNDRPTVNVKWLDSLNPYNTILRLTAITKNKGQKCVIFTDQNARKLYENYIAYGTYRECQITMIHSEYLTNENNDATDVMKNEMLDKPLTIATKYAYAGINFKNKGEKITMIIEAGTETDYAYILQAIGRVRFANIEVWVVKDTNERTRSVEDMRAVSAELMKYKGNKIVAAMCGDDNRYIDYDVLEELEKYYADAAQKEVIIDRLRASGYIAVDDYGEDKSVERGKVNNKYKKSESDYFISWVAENPDLDAFLTSDYGSVYVRQWKHRLNRLRNEMTDAAVQDYIRIRKEDSNVQMETIISEMESIIEIGNLPKNVKISLRGDYRTYAKGITAGWQVKKAQDAVVNRCRKYHDLLMKVDVDKIERGDSITDDLLDFSADAINEGRVRIRERNSASGKKGSPKKKIRIRWVGKGTPPEWYDENGEPRQGGIIEFDSKDNCRRYINCSTRTFAKFIKGEQCSISERWEIVVI